VTDPHLPCPHCGELIRVVNLPAFADPPPEIPVEPDQTHLAGPDGKPIAELLAGPKAFAMSAIVVASMAATERARVTRRIDPRFWSQADLGNVAASLAGLMGYSDLVGRARIRLYQLAARRQTQAFASPKDLLKLAPDWSILAPLRGIGRAILEDLKSLANFFADIFLGTDFVPAGWPEFYRDLGFRRAVDTEAVVREKVESKIVGVPPEKEPPTAEDILNEIGVGPANPSYPTVVVDINSHERFNVGGQEEQSKPEVAADLPAWRYEAVPRPTSRPHHLARRGNIYPASTPFEVIRGTDISETANCLCSWVPVSGAGASSGAEE
jgi:hypothetical protein